MTEQAIDQTNGAESAPVTPTELNINDLVAMRNLIDVVTKRGAFQANELSSVGVLYDKLNGFLEAVQAQQAQPAAVPQEATGE